MALVITTSSFTAQADPGHPSNIPARASDFAAPATADAEAPAGSLALPYEPWQGTRFEPPKPVAATDLPPPLARPRQLPRRPLELSLAVSTFLPNCGSGSVDDRACLTVAPGSGLDAALLYRATPYFAFGAEAVLSGFGGRGHGLLSSASGDARFFGATGRVYFAAEGAWDPYLALTLGAGTLSLAESSANDRSVSSSGFGGRVAGGVDYLFGSRVRVGPTASFSRFVAWSEQQCQGSVCGAAPAIYGRIIGFATLGLRVTASFGDVL